MNAMLIRGGTIVTMDDKLGDLKGDVLVQDGRIAQVWRKVKVKGHVEAVLEAVKAL